MRRPPCSTSAAPGCARCCPVALTWLTRCSCHRACAPSCRVDWTGCSPSAAARTRPRTMTACRQVCLPAQVPAPSWRLRIGPQYATVRRLHRAATTTAAALTQRIISANDAAGRDLLTFVLQSLFYYCHVCSDQCSLHCKNIKSKYF